MKDKVKRNVIGNWASSKSRRNTQNACGEFFTTREENLDLFETFLCSYPSRFCAKKALIFVTQIIDYIH